MTIELITDSKKFSDHVKSTVTSIKKLRERIHVECLSALNQIHAHGNTNWFAEIANAYISAKGIDLAAINAWLVKYSGFTISYDTKSKTAKIIKTEQKKLMEYTDVLFTQASDDPWYEGSRPEKMLAMPKPFGQSFTTALSRLLALGNKSENDIIDDFTTALATAKADQEGANDWVTSYRDQQDALAAASREDEGITEEMTPPQIDAALTEELKQLNS